MGGSGWRSTELGRVSRLSAFWKMNFRTGDLKASEVNSYLYGILGSHFRRSETGDFLARSAVSLLWGRLSHTDADRCTDTVESQRARKRKKPGLTLNSQSSHLVSLVLGTQAWLLIPSLTLSWRMNSGVFACWASTLQLSYILCPPLLLVFCGARDWTQGHTHMR